MVEVAGIEPASKDKPRAESTYLVVYCLKSLRSNNQNLQKQQFQVFIPEPEQNQEYICQYDTQRSSDSVYSVSVAVIKLLMRIRSLHLDLFITIDDG